MQKEGTMSTKPWMVRRSGETQSEQIDRLNRTCYHCGKFFRQVSECNKHETECEKRPH